MIKNANRLGRFDTNRICKKRNLPYWIDLRYTTSRHIAHLGCGDIALWIIEEKSRKGMFQALSEVVNA